MKQMGQQMSAAMAQMQAAMKNMPPEQRAMMEKMMKGKMPQAAAAGSQDRVHGQRQRQRQRIQLHQV